MEDIEKIKFKLSELGFARKTWTPITKSKKGKITDSKFCGKPILLKDESWPKCTQCKESLQLFLQLNLEDLPKEYISEFGENFTGYVQLFYCTNVFIPKK
ncbi:MAG: DUF1963 domain-containing protein [Candidatus Sericytochromatia bacterium]